MSPREEIHKLVEAIPDAHLDYAKRLLAGLSTQPSAPSQKCVRPMGSIEELAARLAAEVPDEEWDSLPPDLTDNLDHYLYGTPKR